MKKNKIAYWITTGLIFLMEGVMPALTSQSKMAKEGISHLGYPEYFGNALVVFKVLGALILIIPKLPRKLKELAYAGFTFNFLFASISHGAVDGVNIQTFFPFIILAILATSYYNYTKLNENH
jgi:uncharacterized membrane protein YphA (DoxX/SURF4 family)